MLAMRHRHRGLSTYVLNGQRQGDEQFYDHSGRGTIYLTLLSAWKLALSLGFEVPVILHVSYDNFR